MSTEANDLPKQVGPCVLGEHRPIQLIDLHSQHPAELEQLLDRWRALSLRREHIADVQVCRDLADSGHLVLQVEFEVPAARECDDDLLPSTEEAIAVVGLLDQPPRFRPYSGSGAVTAVG
jgi:hypothetical protein